MINSAKELMSLINGPCPPSKEEQIQFIVEQQNNLISRLKQIVTSQKQQLDSKNSEINDLRQQLGMSPIQQESKIITSQQSMNSPKENARQIQQNARQLPQQLPQLTTQSPSNICIFGTPISLRNINQDLHEKTLFLTQQILQKQPIIQLDLTQQEFTQITTNIPEFNCDLTLTDNVITAKNYIDNSIIQETIYNIIQNNKQNQIISAVEFLLNSTIDESQNNFTELFKTSKASLQIMNSALLLILRKFDIFCTQSENVTILQNDLQINFSLPEIFNFQIEISSQLKRIQELISRRQKKIICESSLQLADISSFSHYEMAIERFKNCSILSVNYELGVENDDFDVSAIHVKNGETGTSGSQTALLCAPAPPTTSTTQNPVKTTPPPHQKTSLLYPQTINSPLPPSNFTSFGIPISFRVSTPKNFVEICTEIFVNFKILESENLGFLPEIFPGEPDLKGYLSGLQEVFCEKMWLQQFESVVTIIAEFVVNREVLTGISVENDVQFLFQRFGILNFVVSGEQIVFLWNGKFKCFNFKRFEELFLSSGEVQGREIGEFCEFEKCDGVKDAKIVGLSQYDEYKLIRQNCSREEIGEYFKEIQQYIQIKQLVVTQCEGYLTLRFSKKLCGEEEAILIVEM